MADKKIFLHLTTVNPKEMRGSDIVKPSGGKAQKTVELIEKPLTLNADYLVLYEPHEMRIEEVLLVGGKNFEPVTAVLLQNGRSIYVRETVDQIDRMLG